MVASLLIAVALLTGCGDDSDDSAEPSETTASTPDAPGLAERCRDEGWASGDVTEPTLTTDDGLELHAAELGEGSTGVVLISGTSSEGLCNWSKVAPALADDGFQVLALDHRCVDTSECGPHPDTALDLDVVAGVRHLRDRGVEKVVLIGESRGGALALATAARPDVSVDGVVALSAVEIHEIYTGPDPAPLADLVQRIDVPVLYVASLDDTSVDPEEHETWVNATPDAESVMHDDLGHGALMLGDPTADGDGSYFDDVLPFLEARG